MLDRLFRAHQAVWRPHGRRGGGVSAVEIALGTSPARPYGVPIYQMLGGRFRDQVRVYCNTDAEKPSGTETGQRLKARMDLDFTFLKMDLGLMQIGPIPGAVAGPCRRARQVSAPSAAAATARSKTGKPTTACYAHET